MLVADLIEELKYLPQDAEVHFEYNYGDHWRTTVASKVGQVEMGFVKYSAYHQMDKVVSDYDEDMPDAETLRPVVLIG